MPELQPLLIGDLDVERDTVKVLLELLLIEIHREVVRVRLTVRE